MRLTQLNGLLAFVTVAERRGFSAAARTLGVSPSALSQAIRNLEARVGVTLLVRTTRSVSLTEAGERLLARSSPSLKEALAAVEEASGASDAVVGRLRLTVPRIAVPLIIEPVLPVLRQRHPQLAIEISVDDRFVDIMAEGHDAGIRLSEAVERDMVVVRISPPFRFVVVGAPSYLKARGRPVVPKDLLGHECIGYRAATSGTLYQWEFERRGRESQVAVRGSLVCNDAELMGRAAVAGLGLAYVSEQVVAEDIEAGRLEVVLEDYAPEVPGLFLYFPSRAQKLPKLRALIDAVRSLSASSSRL
ncbi:LysR family transcriptional regulator [Hyalangium versicolor]|uniref:LysR family transcriptional regulator n=1 Tax=Hyalangium versicolor TaxID=2861190 RepID=UPI001CC960A2|nr:LysR family transcriptional regulator [Hyalangium versicolor]